MNARTVVDGWRGLFVAALPVMIAAMVVLAAYAQPAPDETPPAEAPASAREPGGDPAAAQPPVEEPAATQPSAAASQPDVEPRIELNVRQSRVIEAPWPTKRVAVTDPAIADVQVLTPQRILVQAKSPGSTDLVMWSASEQVWRARIDVAVDIERIADELRRLFPDTTLEAHKSQDLLLVSGKLRRAEQVDALRRYLTATGTRFVDLTTLAGQQQVQLRVRVAEVSRTAIRSLGFNALWTGSDFFGGLTIGPGGTPVNPVSIGPPAGAIADAQVPFIFNADVNVTPAVTFFAGFPEAPFQFFLQALAENQYLRVLAEPNLVALSGEEASFLAGGEYPIPTVQGGVLAAASVTIEYKQFGVQLRFRPTVLGDGVIRLYVAPEVSQLSDQGAVIIQGFRVPSLVTRRAQTTLDLKNGQTFAMAGLLQRQTAALAARIPGAGDIPVLGALFRSVRYQENETELVVLVTASLVEPMDTSGQPPAPGMAHVTPNDWELYGLARLEGKGSGRLSPEQQQWVHAQSLDQLRGPGAWATYEQQVQPAGATDAAEPAPATLPEATE